MNLITTKNQLTHCYITTTLLLTLLFFPTTLASTQATPSKPSPKQSNQMPKLTIVTEHLPPIQVVQNNIGVSGMAVEIVQQLLIITEEQAVIEGHNWARAYKMAKEQPNVMIFSITRNHIREHQFHWVGMINKLDNYLWRLKSRTDITISTLEHAKQYTIAVPKGDIQHQILKDYGFKETQKLVVVTRYSQALKMFLLGRVDLIIGSTMVLKDKLSPLGHTFDQLEPVLEIRNNIGDIYIAFSLSTPMAQVEKYRRALKQIKQNGIHQRIVEKYQ